MIKVRDAARSSAKWSQNTSQAGSAYADGVQNPKVDWAQATVAGQENYKQAVTKAANEGRFARGVQKAGTAKQQNNAITKGVSRFATGVAVAQPEYAAAMEPVLNTIAAVNLPPRKPKGDPSNIQRVTAVATALHAATKGPGR